MSPVRRRVPAGRQRKKMTETVISVAAEGVWHVVGELGFDTVPGLLAESRRLDAGQSDLIVDLGGVTRANSAGLVLLLEWLDDGRRRQRAVRFRHLPDSLRNIARVSNVVGLLPLAPNETAAPAVPHKKAATESRKKKAATAVPKKKVGSRRNRRKPRRRR